MRPSKPTLRLARRRLRRGQSTVEYSVVAHFILLGGGVFLFAYANSLFGALNAYLEGIYFVLRSSAV